MLTQCAALDIARLFRFFDATCRKDLATQRIISERDYVSNLATHIRYPHGALRSDQLKDYKRLRRKVWFHPALYPRFVSVTSAPNIEQKYGCDGIIIFSFDLGKHGTLHRVGMYEAKWPRLHEHTHAILNGWDDSKWRPTSHKRKPAPPYVFKSRFTNELLLQEPLARAGIVVWEQLFCQLAVPLHTAEFRKYGSTCVMHEQARAYLAAQPELLPSAPVKSPKPRAVPPGHRAWNGRDLSNLLQGGSLSFGRLIYLMLRPNRCGGYLQTGNNYLTIRLPSGEPPTAPVVPPPDTPPQPRRPVGDNANLLRIPVFPNDGAAADNPLAITRFMRNNGFNSYLHVTINSGFIPPEELAAFLETLKAEKGA